MACAGDADVFSIDLGPRCRVVASAGPVDAGLTVEVLDADGESMSAGVVDGDRVDEHVVGVGDGGRGVAERLRLAAYRAVACLRMYFRLQ